jgi:hypothetical protein
MRHYYIFIIFLAFVAFNAQASIEERCEPWKGGTEIRCLGKKISGDAPEASAFAARVVDRAGIYHYSEWWSACGAAGVLLENSSFHYEHVFEVYFHYRLILPNQCHEIFFYSCSLHGNAVPCPSLIQVRGTGGH